MKEEVDWKKALDAMCRMRRETTHAKHVYAWEHGYYDKYDLPPHPNEYEISCLKPRPGKWVVSVTFVRRERSSRLPWRDTILTSASKVSEHAAYRAACEVMVTQWDTFGKPVTLEEAVFRLSVSGFDVAAL